MNIEDLKGTKGQEILAKYRDQLNALTPEERQRLEDIGMHLIHAKWFPIDTAPKNGYLLLAGPSSYGCTPLRVEVCKWAESHGNWRNHAFDAFTDGGMEPTHWMPLPQFT